MSLKNILSKITASFIVMYMVFGNFMIAGIGMGKVIAENFKLPKTIIHYETVKFVNYDNVAGKGVSVKSKLEIGQDIEKQENYQPIQKIELEITAPKINGQNPERVSIIKNNTLLTNGKNNEEINQNYDSNSGLLSISYENKENYSEYKENAKDEFEIIYIYPEVAYKESDLEEDLTIVCAVKANITYANGHKAEKNENFEVKSNQNIKGEIAELTTVQTTDIYKGFMYSNEQNKTNYETSYTQKEQIEIVNSGLLDKLVINEDVSKYISKDKKEVNANIEYKNTTIAENTFKKILGIDGYADIFVNGEKYATVRYNDADKNENRKYIVEYVNGEKKETAGKVEFAERTNQIQIITSKPQTEGSLEVFHEKAIVGTNVKNVEELKAIKEIKVVTGIKQTTLQDKTIDENHQEVITEKQLENKITESKEEKIIELKEPTTQMQLLLDNYNLSTLSNNKIRMTIKLNDTNSSCKLFEKSNLEVTLPNNLVNAKLISAKSLYENGLKIESATIQDGKVVLKIDGKQTAYDTQNISGGVNIVLDLELDIENTTPTHKENLELSYKNVKETAEINIVSKTGLLMLSEITGYDSKNNTLTTMDKNIQKVEIASEEKAKEVTQTLTLVNNYDQKIQQIQMIGRIGYTNQELVSTFDTALTQPIKANSKNVKVYYSNKKDASYDDENWQETYTKDAKSYKIVFDQNELNKMQTIEIKLYFELPMNIGYNQSTYMKTEMNYVYNEQKETSTTTVGMYTKAQELEKNKVKIQKDIVTKQGEIIPITLGVSPNITESRVHSKQLVSYKITVENHSKKDLKDLYLESIIPENAIYTYLEEKQDGIANYIETIQNQEMRQKTWKIETLKANSIQEYEVLLTMADVDQAQEIVHQVNLEAEGQNASVESKLTLKPALVIASLETKQDDVLNMSYHKNDIVEYYIKVKNITSEKLKNAKVTYEIPQYLEYTEGGMGTFDEFNGYTITKQGEYNYQNIFEYEIEQLKPNEEVIIVIRCKVKGLENNAEAKITSIANVILENDIYQTNIKKIEIEQAAFEVNLKVDTKGKEILSKDDSVIYTITAKNIGKRPAMFEIQDAIPNEIEVNQIDYHIDGKNRQSIVTSTQSINLTNTLQEGETLNVIITGKIKEIEVEEETELNVENVAKLVQGEDILLSNAVTFKMKPEWKKEENAKPNPKPDIPNEDTENKPSENPEEEKTYSIKGIAWLDSNKDGKRNHEEKLLTNMKATLIDAQKGEIVKEKDGKVKTSITDENDMYQFTDLPKGKYLVMFEFDVNQYTVTTYQKSGIYPTENSDVIMNKVKINGEEKLVAITDNLVIESEDKNNIDIGLIENAIFDLSLQKVISKVTVTNDQGTKTVEYENKNFVKTDLVAKYMNHTNVIITYRFIIKNEGDITGYVNQLVDDLPSGLEFSSDLNKEWYKGSDGKLYTTSFNEFAIRPGESSVIELVLTKKTTEDTTGTFSNKAEITQISNLEAIQENTPEKANNQSSADIVISIKTGSIMMYMRITLICILIIGAGAYLIKKKVLNKGI